MTYTVGELAQLSGLTVHALHHYEALGLLVPSHRSGSGYRHYTDDDVARLHRIVAYQQMGLALKDIAPLCGPDAPPLADVLARQVARAEMQLQRQQRLLEMLRRVEQRARDGGPGLTDQLLVLVSLMRACERHFSDEEIDRMRAMQDAMGPEGLARVREELEAILAGLRAAHQRREEPGAPAVAALARRLLAIGARFPDDAALRDKGRQMLARERGWQQATGLTPALVRYMDEALAAVRPAADAPDAPDSPCAEGAR